MNCGAIAISSIALLAAAVHAADVVPPPSAQVTVVAERPGPRLWRVSSEHGTLWILGTQTPLPQHMKWRSAEVEAAIAASDEVLGAYSVSLRTTGLQPIEPQSLRRALPKKVYRRWIAMRDRYIDPRLDTEQLLPAAAALFLQAGAYEHAGLTSTDDVWRSIHGLARLYGVPVRRQQFEVERESHEKISQRESREAGVRFLVQTMDRLEADLAMSSRRANAWADGDLATLMQLAPSDESYAAAFARSWPFLSDEEVARIIRNEDTRLAANFERALNRNRTTFAALPIYLLTKRGGALSILAAAGYRVERPEDREG
ncbi:MAG TPA: TraB/GumN family protein [Povalibacter sp.]|uniref:TraB/GumN family protein n=1 Tax=Povalibacter sp. TaxID=1962978 RepID=UPI002C4099F7|nr:TraB/GumN family protein [Povalibacter sp.]HMN45400.1 TraB/GumN family protein [Povalibacter sp.]